MRVYDVRAPAAFESGGGGLVATAVDYARFLQFMLNRGNGVFLMLRDTVSTLIKVL